MSMPRTAMEDATRFPMVIPPAEKSRLIRAAAIEQTTLKEFMLRNSLHAADQVIERAERIRLSEEQSRFLLNLLDNPPEPNQKLCVAARLLAAQE
ncbi:MAG: DUF1778 domain-containing protein [Magnetococcus sp. YQC-9]